MGTNEREWGATERRVLIAAAFVVAGLFVAALLVQLNRGPLGPSPVPDPPSVIDLTQPGSDEPDRPSLRWPGLPPSGVTDQDGDVLTIDIAEPGQIVELTVTELSAAFGGGIVGVGTDDAGVRVFSTLVLDDAGDWEPAYRMVSPWNLTKPIDVPVVIQVDEIQSTHVLRLTPAPTALVQTPNDVVIDPSSMDQLANLVQIVGDGPTRFLLPPGEYREISVVPRAGQSFVGASGPEPTILNGSRLVTSWERGDGETWIAVGQSHRPWGFLDGNEKVRRDPSDDEWGTCQSGERDVCKLPELLFFDDVPLRRVKERSQLEPGRWYFDYAADEIIIADDPTGREIEFSATPRAFSGNVDDVRIENMVVRQYASPMRQGAIQPRRGRIEEDPGQNWVISGVEVAWNHGYGIKVDIGMIIEHSWIHDNFQMGIGAGSSTNVIIRRSEISGNCAGSSVMGALCDGNSGGGVKLDFSDRPILRENFVHGNDPHRIHIDQFSTDAVIVGNVTIGNSRAGLHFEISSGALIEGNYVAGHGEAGILVISSSGVSVSGNHVTGNVSAILVRQDERCRSGRPECVHQLLVQDNYVDIGEGDTGLTWSSRRAPDPFTVGADNHFESNVYVVAPGNCRSEPFLWSQSTLDWSDWSGRGLDSDGHIIWPDCVVAAGDPPSAPSIVVYELLASLVS